MFTSGERNSAERLIRQLYQRMKLAPRPGVVWCQSPLQLVMLPTLLPALAACRGFETAPCCQPGSSNLVPFRRRSKGSGGAGRPTPALLAPANLRLFGEMWRRLELAIDSLAASAGSHFQLGPAMTPEEGELDGLVSAPPEAAAERLLVEDLHERVNTAYTHRDSRMNGTFMTDQFYDAISARLPDSFARYLLGLYTDRSKKACLSEADLEMAGNFLYTNLNFLSGNIHFIKIADQGCACIFFKNVCFVLERPLAMACDSLERLHREDGPVLLFPDGYAVYALEGIPVSRDMIEDPDWLTVERIADETNQELRRLMLKRYGVDRFIADSNACKLSEDEFGVLYCKDLPDEESLKFVKVVNSTPEPDGNLKEYFLRVPGYVESPRAAVAWTFGMTAEEYKPDWES